MEEDQLYECAAVGERPESPANHVKEAVDVSARSVVALEVSDPHFLGSDRHALLSLGENSCEDSIFGRVIAVERLWAELDASRDFPNRSLGVAAFPEERLRDLKDPQASPFPLCLSQGRL